jgi:hypothetical protein
MKKCFWKRFVKSNKGSVSVYLIVIIVPIFIFHAVLIDFVRVKLVERESELAVKTGLRSVLAGFDLNLQPFGLYALKDEVEQANPLFAEMIKQNLTPHHPGKYLNLLDEALNDHSNTLKAIYTLANQTVFHQQILEEMKYVTPLEYTLEIVNKFKKPEIAEQLVASKQIAETTEKLEELLEQRNQSLDEAWAASTEYLQSADSMISKYNQQINNLDDVDVSDAIIRTLENIHSELNTDYAKLTNNYSNIVNQLAEAEAKNSLLSAEKIRLTAGSGVSNESNDIYKNFLVYDVNYFVLYRTELSKTLAHFSGLRTLLENTKQSAINSNFFEIWRQAADKLSQQTVSFHQMQNAIESQRQQAYNQTKLKKNEQKSKLNQALDTAKARNQGCGIISEDAYSHAYQLLKGDSNGVNQGFYAKYQNYNNNSLELVGNEPNFELESGEKTSKNSLNWIQLFSGKLEGFRDDLYLDEYALNKFNYRTIANNASVSEHALKNQEVEYILYGLGSCSANYAAAYSEMYIMLLAIRTMENLMKPQNEMLNIGSPFLVFLAAAAQGALEAYQDMNKLLNGEAIPILQKTSKLTVDYKQLLRMFLLLHHKEERIMSRMQALIELETNTPLEHKATYIQGSAGISLRLWFMPAFYKSLNIIGLSTCETVGNRCEIKKTAVISY